MRVLTDLTDRQRFDALLEAEHFLGPRFPAGDRLYQVAEQDGHWVGLLLWCAPALHLKDRDAWIGWDPLTRAQRLNLLVNQARFLIPDAVRRLNLASQILAAATAALPGPWFAQHGYAPLLAQTFTDPESHAGTCYKAAGWEPVGTTAGFARQRCDCFAFHDRPKRLWLKPLADAAQAKLCAQELGPRHAPAQTVGAAARCALNAAQRYRLKDALRQVPDPLHCQKETAPLLTQEKGGDFVLGVKGNQPTVRANAAKKLAGATPLLSRPNPAAAASKPAP